MGLRIANNIAAMNTQRWLGVADTGMKKSLERLSSGYRINRAADDAAGLAISQSFRADIASFKVASRNTSEAKSLLQVAEGAMDQIGNMLTRLKELATQAASANAGTELGKIDAEKVELLTEIERIANVTEYAGTKLINGTFGGRSGVFIGGTATSVNSYGIGVDVAGVADYSQMIKFTDAQHSTRAFGSTGGAASDADHAYAVDSDYNKYTYTDTDTSSEIITLDIHSSPVLGSDVTLTLTSVNSGNSVTLTVADGPSQTILHTGNATLDFTELGIALVNTEGVFDAAEVDLLATDTIRIDATGISGAPTVDSSVAGTVTGTFTVTDSTDSLITFDKGGSTYTATISNGVAYSNELGLTINLDGDYGADDLNNLTFTIANGAQTSTDTTTIALSMAKTGIDTTGTYNLDRVGSTDVFTLGNGSITDTGTISGTTLTFSNLGITLVGDSALTAANLDNDSLVVTNTGITAISIGASTNTGTYTIAHAGNDITIGNGTSTQVETGSDDVTSNFDQLGIKITFGDDYAAEALNSLAIFVEGTNSKDFQVGATNDTNDRISVTIGNVKTGDTGLNIAGLSLLSATDAQSALTTIDNAISSLGDTRGNIGAAMNRLDYAYANLASTIENVQAAESVIRDVDMASEMTDFTKNQILLQAGTAMLAQANMAPQQVLALFG